MTNHAGPARRRGKALACGLTAGLTVALLASFWPQGCTRRGRPGPNIIFISIDTLRADHLGCYGYTRETSPHIDRFAAEALLFENCRSHAPNTWSSCASILTGYLPHETTVVKNVPLPEAVETLPEVLRSRGYHTVAVVSNYVLRKGEGFDQGFMIYDDEMGDLERNREDLPERVAQRTTDRAIELLKSFQEKQLFMWVHYQDPHGPYLPPPRFTGLFSGPDQEPRNIRLNKTMSGRGGIPSYQKLGASVDFHYYESRYDAEIRYVDEQFGRLIDTLKALGFYEEALIILTSDHGEGMGERNYYFAHGENLYRNLTHVPLIVRYGASLTGRRVDFVQHIDIVPTICAILGLETDSHLRGRDLRRQTWAAQEIFAEKPSRWAGGKTDCSITWDGHKLIATMRRPPASEQEYELFDLRTDPLEQHDLIQDPRYQERAGDLKARLDRVRGEDSLVLGPSTTQRELSDEEKANLKSLGYVP